MCDFQHLAPGPNDGLPQGEAGTTLDVFIDFLPSPPQQGALWCKLITKTISQQLLVVVRPPNTLTKNKVPFMHPISAGFWASFPDFLCILPSV